MQVAHWVSLQLFALLVFTCCVQTKQWTPLAVTLPLTQGRHFSSYAYDYNLENPRIYVFGGNTHKIVSDGEKIGVNVVVGTLNIKIPLNELWVYDINTKVWFLVDVNSTSAYNMPPARSQASLVYHEGNLYLFGGVSRASWDFVDSTVYKINVQNVSITSQLTWENITTSGAGPGYRFGHSAIVDTGSPNPRMIVFGGYWPIPDAPKPNPDGFGPPILQMPHYFNDIHALDLVTYTWTLINSTSRLPDGRGWHSANTIGDNMYIFGGERLLDLDGLNRVLQDIWSFNLRTNIWTNLTASMTSTANFPTPRSSVASAVDASNTFILIAGGEHYSTFYGDIFKYFPGNNSWLAIPLNYPSMPPRYGHIMVPSTKSEEFIVTTGFQFTYTDLKDVGILDSRYLVSTVNGSLIEIGSDITSIHFPGSTPKQRMIPYDNCGERSTTEFLEIQFNSIREVSPQGSIVQAIDFTKSEYSINTKRANGLTFSLSGDPDLSLFLDFLLFNSSQTTNYANTSFTLNPGDNKFSLNLTNWKFIDDKDHIELEIAFETSNNKFTALKRDVNREEKRVLYSFISATVTAKVAVSVVAIVDGVVQTVYHDVIFNSLLSDYRIKFFFPRFNNSLIYDPDFGIVLNNNQDQSESECNPPILTTIQILIIVFCVVGFCIVVIVAVLILIFFWFKGRKQKKIKGNVDLEGFEMSTTHSSELSLSDSSDDISVSTSGSPRYDESDDSDSSPVDSSD